MGPQGAEGQAHCLSGSGGWRRSLWKFQSPCSSTILRETRLLLGLELGPVTFCSNRALWWSGSIFWLFAQGLRWCNVLDLSNPKGLCTPEVWRHSLAKFPRCWIPRSVLEQGLKSPDPRSYLSVIYKQRDPGQDLQPICEVGPC